MSQQHMDYNETGQQQQAGYNESYQSGYRDPFVASYGQKVGQAPGSENKTATSAQRMGLAIVSVIMLTGVAAGLFSSTNLITAGVVAMLIGLLVVLVVAAAFVAINWLFSRR